MPTIISEGRARAVAISTDEPSARYRAASVRRGTLPVAGTAAASGRHRVVLETLQNAGGMLQRALLGAEFVAGAGSVELAVGLSGDLTSGAAAGCRSALGRPLVAGLPDEFADAVLAGALAAGPRLPPGVLTVDRAGYDEADSSARAFRRAAALLVDVLAAQLAGQDPQPQVQVALRGW